LVKNKACTIISTSQESALNYFFILCYEYLISSKKPQQGCHFDAAFAILTLTAKFCHFAQLMLI
jgi:hypothetical protein